MCRFSIFIVVLLMACPLFGATIPITNEEGQTIRMKVSERAVHHFKTIGYTFHPWNRFSSLTDGHVAFLVLGNQAPYDDPSKHRVWRYLKALKEQVIQAHDPGARFINIGLDGITEEMNFIYEDHWGTPPVTLTIISKSELDQVIANSQTKKWRYSADFIDSPTERHVTVLPDSWFRTGRFQTELADALIEIAGHSPLNIYALEGQERELRVLVQFLARLNFNFEEFSRSQGIPLDEIVPDGAFPQLSTRLITGLSLLRNPSPNIRASSHLALNFADLEKVIRVLTSLKIMHYTESGVRELNLSKGEQIDQYLDLIHNKIGIQEELKIGDTDVLIRSSTPTGASTGAQVEVVLETFGLHRSDESEFSNSVVEVSLNGRKLFFNPCDPISIMGKHMKEGDVHARNITLKALPGEQLPLRFHLKKRGNVFVGMDLLRDVDVVEKIIQVPTPTDIGDANKIVRNIIREELERALHPLREDVAKILFPNVDPTESMPLLDQVATDSNFYADEMTRRGLAPVEGFQCHLYLAKFAQTRSKLIQEVFK